MLSNALCKLQECCQIWTVRNPKEYQMEPTVREPLSEWSTKWLMMCQRHKQGYEKCTGHKNRVYGLWLLHLYCPGVLVRNRSMLTQREWQTRRFILEKLNNLERKGIDLILRDLSCFCRVIMLLWMIEMSQVQKKQTKT